MKGVAKDLDGPSVGATCGEIMATVFKAFGCAGLVLNDFTQQHDRVSNTLSGQAADRRVGV